MPKFERAMPLNEESSGDRISDVREKSQVGEPEEVAGPEKKTAWEAVPEVQIESPYHTDEQVLTRHEAYKAYTARMTRINAELGNLLAAKQPTDKARRDALIKEAEALNVWMKSVGDEEVKGWAAGDLEESELVVSNPFYGKHMEEEAPQDTADAEMEFFEGKKRTPEAPQKPEEPQESQEQVQAEYEAAKTRLVEINDALGKLEARERQIISVISDMHEETSQMREELRHKPIDALESLLGTRFSKELKALEKLTTAKQTLNEMDERAPAEVIPLALVRKKNKSSGTSKAA
jgi:hypothetical protein